MNTKKIILLFAILMLTVSTISPGITAFSENFFSKPLSQHNTVESSQKGLIKLVHYESDSIIEEYKEVSIKEALEIIQIINDEDSSFSVEQLFSSIKSNGMITEKRIERRTDELSLFKDDHMLYHSHLSRFLGSYGIFDMMCHIHARIFGIGFVMGTHSIPILSLLPGIDFAGIFLGIGSIDVTDGLFDDSFHSGLCLGGMLGFAGKILLVILPMIPGPFIFLDGFALVTFWL